MKGHTSPFKRSKVFQSVESLDGEHLLCQKRRPRWKKGDEGTSTTVGSSSGNNNFAVTRLYRNSCFPCCDESCLSLRACADKCLASRVTSVPQKCVLCWPLCVWVWVSARGEWRVYSYATCSSSCLSLENSKLLAARELFAKFGVVTVPCGEVCVGKC